jgi:hypothetical protein
VTHTDHPWPRDVFDRRIAVDADRMSNAVKTYRAGPAPLTKQSRPSEEVWEKPPQPTGGSGAGGPGGGGGGGPAGALLGGGGAAAQ